MPTYAYNPAISCLLAGDVDYAILVRGKQFIAWNREKEGPGRPDAASVIADLHDMLDADGVLTGSLRRVQR
jgi:hypothetical protein